MITVKDVMSVWEPRHWMSLKIYVFKNKTEMPLMHTLVDRTFYGEFWYDRDAVKEGILRTYGNAEVVEMNADTHRLNVYAVMEGANE